MEVLGIQGNLGSSSEDDEPVLPKVEQDTGTEPSKSSSGKNGRHTTRRRRGSKHKPSKLNILLVEDNKINAKVASMVLHRLGHTVLHVENGADALDFLRKEPNGPSKFDAVLMDLHMPKMGGFEATSAIRTLWPDVPVPIVALTADAFEDTRKRCLSAGFTAWLAKPFKVEALEEVLRHPDILAEEVGSPDAMRRLGTVLREKAKADWKRLTEGTERSRATFSVVDELAALWTLDESEELLEELEDGLLAADLGPDTSRKVADAVREGVKRGEMRDGNAIRDAVKASLVRVLEGGGDATLAWEAEEAIGRPMVGMIVGVNGGGKTTTIGKMAHRCHLQGLVLTKLDGTSKGGAVVGVVNALKLPVKLIGVGEGIDDLQPFDPQAFVDALLPDKTSK
eukprot:jgi/Pico_ML_1/52057/g2827.t1